VDRITGYPVDLRSRKPKPMEREDITREIIGCVYKVYNTMGFGFLESVYEKCLVIELRRAGLKVEAQKPVPVRYAGRSVGDFTADLVVEETVIVELKSVQRLTKAHEIQLVNYLVATGLPVGLLVNFGEAKAEVRRKVRQLTNQKGSTGYCRPSSCNPVQTPASEGMRRAANPLTTPRRPDAKLR
jgi:GxxExxY protein